MRHGRPRATRALWWGAPQAADPGPRKTPKILHPAGENFLDGIRVAHKRLQEHNPAPPIVKIPEIGENAVFTHLSDNF